MRNTRLRTHLYLAAALRFFQWRGPVVLLVFAIGLAGFMTGAGVTDRPNVESGGTLIQIYYTIGLFVLGGMDLGSPTGGPWYAQAMLWFAYFAAPAITTSAVIEGFFRAMRREKWRRMPRRDHIVIAGCGKLTMLYLRRLRAVDQKRHIIVVEVETNRTHAEEAREIYGAELIWGDITSDAILEQLRLATASRLLLLTGDDFVNLDGASKILEIAPGLASKIAVHVADIRMQRVLKEGRLLGGCQVFNSHKIAAEELVDTGVLPHFEATEPKDVVVLAGFGRFGQTVLDELQKKAQGKFDHVVIIDEHARRLTAMFEEQVQFSESYKRTTLEGDIRNVALWRDVAEQFKFDAIDPVFVLGSSDDGTNIQAAITLKKLYPQAFVVARNFRHSSFATQIAAERGFDIVSVSELVSRRMPEIWFRQ